MKRVAVVVALCIGFGLTGPKLFAQSQSTSLDLQLAEFRARIEALERENASLRKSAPDRAASGPSFAPVPATPVATDIPSTDLEQRLSELEAKFALTETLPAPEGAICEECEEYHVVGSDLDMKAYWKDGFEVATKHKDFRVHVGGRAQVDAGWFDADPSVQDNINRPYENGADFRRARLRIDGTMYQSIEWATEYDFVNGFRDVDFDTDRTITGITDCWVILNDLPMGNLRVGQQKPAIGFEHLVSSRFLPFMERSYNQDSFYGGVYNGFLPGVSLFETIGEADYGTWNVGLFKPTDNVFAASAHDGDFFAVGRMTHLLWYYDEGAHLFHVGGSYAQQTTVGGRVIYRTRDAIRTGLAPSWPVPASTGTIGGDDMSWLNGELAMVEGPWTFQSEYLVSYMTDAAPIVGNVIQTPEGDVFYQGGYAQLLYFLTGEHDNYDKLLGVFTRVRPHENFFSSTDSCGRHCGGGIGAWQVGARYDYLDLNDNGFNGGILHNGTVGLNWFLNPNMKFQFNYMITHRDAALVGTEGDGWINGFGTRFAMDF
jgi:phosphate-selective porin OprO/OprP